MDRWYEQMRDDGRCISCGGEPRGINKNTGQPYTLCVTCHERVTEAAQRRRARLKNQSKCRTCETTVTKINPRTKKPFQYCDRCKVKSNRYSAEKRERYRAEGRCRSCGNAVEKLGMASCRKCLDKMSVRHAG